MSQPSVFVERLQLSHFRNYQQLTLALGGQMNVLTGENGSGKTNMLEALSVFMPGRGLRRAPFEDMACSDGPGSWAVNIGLGGPGGPVRLGSGLMREPGSGRFKRLNRIDGATAAGAGAFAPHIRLVWLTPVMDRLFTGPASERRRFLDRIVISGDPAQSGRLSRFERAMRERNKLLESPGADTAWLDALETQMAEYGVAIAAARRETTARLGALMERFEEAGAAFAFPWARLKLDGFAEDALNRYAAVEVEDFYRTMLSDSRRRDAAAGRTLDGPHRSDLIVRHGPKDRDAKLCSTGEQKALLIALILGQTRMITQLAGGLKPVLLLDEIAAHLDERRRHGLFEILLGMGVQTFMTGTDRTLFAGLEGRADFLTVAEGTVRPSGSFDEETFNEQ
ncbi:MAG: DNA replication/repair protein RecF [Hyphomicrobiales bacterium]|nr:MAG: DNA replication/repair protein RecF [Hyphomicrobiales bacterium]